MLHQQNMDRKRVEAMSLQAIAANNAARAAPNVAAPTPTMSDEDRKKFGLPRRV